MIRALLRRLAIPAIVSIALAFGLNGCGDDEHVTGPFGDKIEGGQETRLASISGTVVGDAGAPVSFVEVTVGSTNGFSDAEGRFFIPGLDPAAEIARFTKDTRTTTNYRQLELVAGGEVHFPRVVLLPLQRSAVFFANAGATATLDAWGSGADFPDSAFASADTLYLGRVGAFMAVARVGEPSFAGAFPGEFRGTRTDGSEVALDALGVIWTYIDSNAGPLQLAPGRTVTYRLGVADGSPAPATAVAFSLDPVNGRWEEIGETDLTDGTYESVAAAITPVCWAVPATDQCAVTGTVVDGAGQPLANARVECRDLAGRFRRAMMSREDGSFALDVSRSDSARVTPYFGSIEGAGAVVSTVADCPAVIEGPLAVTLPDYRIDLLWEASHGDLDAYLFIAGEWDINYVHRGSLDSAPYATLLDDARDDGGPERITGRRWYDGVTEYWVHDYDNRATESLRQSGARVELVINDADWSFAVADADTGVAASDSSGWWHVFDVHVAGPDVTVEPVQRFAPSPVR